MNLPFRIAKKLKDYRQRRHLLAVSGGVDSMALFFVYLHLRKHFGFDFAVAHYHHGPNKDPLQEDFRSRAEGFIRDQCKKQKAPFFSNGDDQYGISKSEDEGGQSEAELRNRRYRFLELVLKEESFDLLVLAHHRDDLLETRLLRLFRGVGPQGLESMSLIQGFRLRPFLDSNPREFKEYLLSCGGSWMEDPGNQSQKPFRNWLRNKWLKDLQERSPGALSALARSLDLMVEGSKTRFSPELCIQEEKVVLGRLLELDREQQKQVLAFYMRTRGFKNYGLSHINEILKRIDTEKKNHTFQLLGCRWNVDAGQMSVGKGQV